MKNIIKNIVNTKKEKNTQKLPMPSHVKRASAATAPSWVP